MKNIVLIGPSGAGKATLGRMVAKTLGYGYVDLDEMVEDKTGLAVLDIFGDQGEEAFRDMETRAAREVGGWFGYVVATGGGVVLREENMAALRQNGFVIFLDRDQETIARDIVLDYRPLLTGGIGKLSSLIQERRPLYENNADAIFNNNGPWEETFEQLMRVIRGAGFAGGYAVIGDPIAHTLSPLIHGAVFTHLGVDEHYRGIHVPRGTLGEFVESLEGFGIKGFNITIPHKQEIIQYLDEVDEEARLAHSVNTVVVRDGKLHGYNTDMNGLMSSIRDNGHEFLGRVVLILGAGGVASSVALKAAREGAVHIIVLARRVAAAEEVRQRVQSVVEVEVSVGDLGGEDLPRYTALSDVIINATPLGMRGYGEDFPSFEFLKAAPKRALVYDLVYAPPLTQLLLYARELGLGTCGGLAMLVYQAIIADELYLDRELDKKELYKVVVDQMNKNK